MEEYKNGLIEEIKTAMALRCVDSFGNTFISEKDLFQIIRNYEPDELEIKVQSTNTMREATKAEAEGVNSYVKSVAKPTGHNFNELIDDVQEEVDFVPEHKKIPCTIKFNQ